MAGLQTTCVAQYLRMSTEHQQYSIDNQAAAIQEYAREHGFTVVRTYATPGPKPDKLKLKGNWRDAVKRSLQKKKPPQGWPK
jgi:DNA invertase Pin-like site-specific DNA recombinase